MLIYVYNVFLYTKHVMCVDLCDGSGVYKLGDGLRIAYKTMNKLLHDLALDVIQLDALLLNTRVDDIRYS